MEPKAMRKRVGSTGWMTLIYVGVLNVCILLFMIGAALFTGMEAMIRGDRDALMEAMMEAAYSGWGYLAALVIVVGIFLLWKKPKFWREQIWKHGKPMKFGDFCAILAVFFCGQMVSQIYNIILETGLNIFGFSMLEGLQSMTGDGDSFSFFLYMAIIGPVAEELAFRGMVLKTLMPFGKRFAIVCSAFLFGIFHCNIIQAPMAFLVGLVLGYVAAEYSIAWAMVLHMINNMFLGDILTRLIPNETAASIVLWLFLVASAITTVIVLIRKGSAVTAWHRSAVSVPGIYKRFFLSFGVISCIIVTAIFMVISFVNMIAPI